MSPTDPIAGILLAAGASVRFGAEKLLAPLPSSSSRHAGKPLAVASYLNLAAELARVVVVVRPGASALAALLASVHATTVECVGADAGMGASLACGVGATETAAGWIVALADMPWIAPQSIRRVVAALRGGAGIVAPTYRGRRGHPVGFGASYRDALLALRGDRGARDVIAAQADDLLEIEVDDPNVNKDVDVPGDLD